MAGLLLLSSLLRCGTGTAFTCIFTLINNSVAREGRGRMQGVAMTIAAVARAVGPTLGAEAFAWSLTSGRRLPLDVHFVFFLMSAISTLPLGIARATFGAGLDCAVDSPLESPLDSTVEVVSAEAAAACAAKVAPPATEEEEERRTNKV